MMLTNHGYFMVLNKISSNITREQILSFYQNATDIKQFKIFQMEGEDADKESRLGIMELYSQEDINRSVVRYLGEREKSMQVRTLKSACPILSNLLDKPTYMKVFFENRSLPFQDKLLNLLKQHGDISILNQRSLASKEEWTLRVDSKYSIGKITTSNAFILDKSRVTLELFEDPIDDGHLHLIMNSSEEVTNRLNHFNQGLGLVAMVSLQHKFCRERTGSDTKEQLEQAIRASQVISESSESEEHVSKCVAELQDPQDLEVDEDYLSTLSDEADDSCEEFVYDSKLVGDDQALAFFSPPHVKDFFSQQVPSISSLVTTPSDVHLEVKISEKLDMLNHLGKAADRENFMSWVNNRIDPHTKESDLLVASLKIIKTKLRKTKRLQKMKGKQVFHESSDDLKALECPTQDIQICKDPRRETATRTEPAENWRKFIKQQTWKRRCKEQEDKEAHEAYPFGDDSDAVAVMSWKFRLKLMSSAPESGWPRFVPANLRLNPQRTCSRRERGYKSAASHKDKRSSSRIVNPQATRKY